MEFSVVGWPNEGPTLRLDYRAFSYAGKFVTPDTGKAVLRDDPPVAPEWTPDRSLPDRVDPDAFAEDVAAAVSFSPDRTEPSVLRLRYVTVHAGLRGRGLGPELIRRTVEAVDAAGDEGGENAYETVRIAVNNPFAYEALYRAGFAFTGRETGVAELVLDRPVDGPAERLDDRERYQAGLDRFRERELSAGEEAFLADRGAAHPPEFKTERA